MDVPSLLRIGKGPVVGGKGNGGKAGLVVEVEWRVVGPGETHGDRCGHLLAGNHHARAVNRCIGPHSFPIRARHGEPNQMISRFRRIVGGPGRSANNQAAFGVIELESFISSFRTINGSAASEMTHRQELRWQLANQMEEIPPYTFLLMEGDVTDSDVEWAKKHLVKFHKGGTLATSHN